MTATRFAGLEAFLRRPDPAIGAVLIYGDDAAAVRDAALGAVTQLAGDADDPFNVVVLTEQAVAADAGRLVDEVQSLSMLGSNRVVWVRSADQNFLKSADPVLAGTLKGNVIIAESGALTKTSALRVRFEESPFALIVALYEIGAEELAALGRAELQRGGFQIDEDALALLGELSGHSKSLLQQEIEKLINYCAGSTTIGLDAVREICGGALGIEPDDLVDAVFAGEVADSDRYFLHLVDSGVDPGRIVSAAHAHALRLMDFRQGINRGQRAEQVMMSARPPVFYKRKPTIQMQLRFWDIETLLSAASSLSGAVLQTRLNSALAHSLANRALLGVARSARVSRQRSN